MAEEHRYIDPYKRKGRLVSGHNKQVHTSNQTKQSGKDVTNLNALQEQHDDVVLFDDDQKVTGWSAMGWGVEVSDAVLDDPSVSNTSWNEITGEGFVMNSEGEIIWLGPNVELVEMNLNGICAPNANLTGATLEECTIEESNLVGAIWDGATLTNVDVKNSDLSGGSMEGTFISRCRFEESCNLSNMNWTNIAVGSTTFTEGDMRLTDATGGQFVNTSFEGMQGAKTIWVDAGMRNVRFRISRLENSNWQGVDIEEVKVAATSLYGSDFSGTKIESFTAYSSDLRKINFFAMTANRFDVHQSCRYEAIPAGYVPVRLLELGQAEGRSNATNETLPRGSEWSERDDYHVPMWSCQTNGLY
jgi:uncharacterized protein YjbI with pentapeptide repeats